MAKLQKNKHRFFAVLKQILGEVQSLNSRNHSRPSILVYFPDPLLTNLPFGIGWCAIWIFDLFQVAGCYVMHQSLQDPEVRFPQISELAVGPTAAKMLYRREQGVTGVSGFRKPSFPGGFCSSGTNNKKKVKTGGLGAGKPYAYPFSRVEHLEILFLKESLRGPSIFFV